jgi:hypothetical protein
VQRKGDFAKAAVVFTGDKNDVVAFAHRDSLLFRDRFVGSWGFANQWDANAI